MDIKKGVRNQFRGMFDGMNERARQDQVIIDAQEAQDDEFRAQSRVDAERALRQLMFLLRGGKPSRDPNWDPGEPLQFPPGMLPVDPHAAEKGAFRELEVNTRNAEGRAYGMEGKTVGELIEHARRMDRLRRGF